MAYGAYVPQNYYQQQYYPNLQMPLQPPQMPQNSVQNSSNGITWVLGENAAKSFPVGAGQTVVLMDREEPIMYMKSVDQSGMPLPLRIFDITERTSEKQSSNVAKEVTTNDYVSRKEFDEFRESVKRSINGFRKPHSEREGDK